MLSNFREENSCPIPEVARSWMDHAFLWLLTQFGQDQVINGTTLLPIAEHFPVRFNGTEQVAYDCTQIVAKQWMWSLIA